MHLTIESLEEARSVNGCHALDRHICEYVETFIGQHVTTQKQRWSELPDIHRLYYATNVLEGEIENGGFEQYLHNLKNQTNVIQDGLDGLQMIGAQEHLALTREAIALFVHVIKELEPLIGNPDNAIHRVEPQKESDIDSRFYELEPVLQQFRYEFAKNHLVEFVAAGITDQVVELYEKAEALCTQGLSAEAAELYETCLKLVQAGGPQEDPSRQRLIWSKLEQVCKLMGKSISPLAQVVAAAPTRKKEPLQVLRQYFLSADASTFLILELKGLNITITSGLVGSDGTSETRICETMTVANQEYGELVSESMSDGFEFERRERLIEQD